MNHDQIQDRLEAYVDETLGREERKEVDKHLASCEECRSILEEVKPVDLSGLGPMAYDESAMRRTVRRSMFRTSFNTALLLLAGWIAIWFLSALVLQPLVLNRGGRAADAMQASIDLGVMTNPGAVLVEGDIDSSLISRRLDLEYALPVGAGLDPRFETSTRVSLLRVGDPGGGPSFISSDDQGFQGDALEQLRNLGEGTVATASVRFEVPLSIEEAQAIADDPGADVRLVWAGFDASQGQGAENTPWWTPHGVLGYGTCQEAAPFDDDLLGASSASFSQGSLFHTASIERARQSVVTALKNITSSRELEEYAVGPFESSPDEVDEVLDDIRSEPQVTMLVITGPSTELTDFISSRNTAQTYTSLLAVDFYNWTQGICGR